MIYTVFEQPCYGKPSLVANRVSVTDFAMTAANGELITVEAIEPSGIGDLSFGEKCSIKKAWANCRNLMGNPTSSSSALAATSKMLKGIEARLRTLYKSLAWIPRQWCMAAQ